MAIRRVQVNPLTRRILRMFDDVFLPRPLLALSALLVTGESNEWSVVYSLGEGFNELGKGEVLLGVGETPTVPAFLWSHGANFLCAADTLAACTSYPMEVICAQTHVVRRRVIDEGGFAGWLPLDYSPATKGFPPLGEYGFTCSKGTFTGDAHTDVMCATYHHLPVEAAFYLPAWEDKLGYLLDRTPPATPVDAAEWWRPNILVPCIQAADLRNSALSPSYTAVAPPSGPLVPGHAVLAAEDPWLAQAIQDAAATTPHPAVLERDVEHYTYLMDVYDRLDAARQEGGGAPGIPERDRLRVIYTSIALVRRRQNPDVYRLPPPAFGISLRQHLTQYLSVTIAFQKINSLKTLAAEQ